MASAVLPTPPFKHVASPTLYPASVHVPLAWSQPSANWLAATVTDPTPKVLAAMLAIVEPLTKAEFPTKVVATTESVTAPVLDWALSALSMAPPEYAAVLA